MPPYGKFDNYTPAGFRLSAQEIEVLIAELIPYEKEDHMFAQKQVRGFFRAQRVSMPDIADETVDAEMCATHLPGQAEHGYNGLGSSADGHVEAGAGDHGRSRQNPGASKSWEDCGEVIVCDTHDKMQEVADVVASEDVQVMTDAAAAEIGACRSWLCMLEGFEGHAAHCYLRVRRSGGIYSLMKPARLRGMRRNRGASPPSCGLPPGFFKSEKKTSRASTSIKETRRPHWYCGLPWIRIQKQRCRSLGR